MGDLTRDTTESTSAPASTTVPEVHTATLDIVSMLAVPAATDGTPEDQAVASTPATCSTICLPRHPVAAPILVASSYPSLTEYGLHTNRLVVSVVPLTMTCEFRAARAPMASVCMFPMQQLYNGSKFFMPTSGQCTASMVHRPMPWPSFMGVRVDGVEARPLTWPSFRIIYECDSPSGAIMKPSQQCSSHSSHAEGCAAIESQISHLCGNLFTSTGYIFTHDLCNPSEWRCLDDVLLIFGYGGFASDSVQSAHTNHTTLARPSCPVSGFHLLAMIRSLELQQLSNGYESISLLKILWEVQISHGYFIARKPVSGLFGTKDWHLLDFPCGLVVTVCLFYSQKAQHYFCHSQLKESLILNSMRRSNSSCDQFCCAIQAALCWPGNFVTGLHMHPKKQHTKLILERARTQLQPTIPGMYLCLSACIQALVLVLCNICSMHTIRSPKCMHVTKDTQRSVQSLRGPNYVLNSQASVLWDVHLIMVKSKQQVTVYCSCLAYCHLGLGTNTIRYSDCKDSMMLVNNSAISNHVKEIHGPYVSAQMQWGDIASVLSCGLIHLGKLCLYLNFGRSTVGRPSLRIPCQFVMADWHHLYNQSIWTRPAAVCISELGALRSTELAVCIQAGLHSFSKSISKTLMQGMSHSNKGIHSWVDSENKFYAGYAVFAQGLVLMCWLHENLTPTRPPLTAYCSLTRNIFRHLDISILLLCEVWLLNYQGVMQILIGWPPSVHTEFISNELAYEDNESCCFLCCYHGVAALFLLLAFGRQAVFQGGRVAIIYSIRYFVHDRYIDNLDYLDSPQVPWDPGGSAAQTFFIYDHDLGSSRISRREGCQGPFPVHRHGLTLGPVTPTVAQVAAGSATTNIQRYTTERASRVGSERMALFPLSPAI